MYSKSNTLYQSKMCKIGDFKIRNHVLVRLFYSSLKNTVQKKWGSIFSNQRPYGGINFWHLLVLNRLHQHYNIRSIGWFCNLHRHVKATFIQCLFTCIITVNLGSKQSYMVGPLHNFNYKLQTYKINNIWKMFKNFSLGLGWTGSRDGWKLGEATFIYTSITMVMY